MGYEHVVVGLAGQRRGRLHEVTLGRHRVYESRARCIECLNGASTEISLNELLVELYSRHPPLP